MTAKEAMEALQIEQIQIDGKAVRLAKFFEGLFVANEALEKQILKEKENEVYREALKKWGDVLQTVVALEEMAELQKELSKNLRGSNNVDAIAEEIADVEIMLAQMKLLHNCRTMVETVKAAKIKRLAERCFESVKGA